MLTSGKQLPGRTQFKHVLFAPSPHNALHGDVFPFVRAAIEKKDWDAAAKAIKMTADKLVQAAEGLV
jgi:N-acetylated-alpha-linked acidic dipeptidase